MLPAAVRQFDRDVRRSAYHARASIRVGLAPECLHQQEKFFGEHEPVLRKDRASGAGGTFHFFSRRYGVS